MVRLADRKQELIRLKDFLKKDDFGLLLVYGKEGTGKTTLLKKLADDDRCLYHSCALGEAKYEPVKAILSSGGIENPHSRNYGEVLSVYAVHQKSGLLIGHVSRKDSALDPDIFAGMLSAVQAFVKDSISMLSGDEDEEYLNTLGYGEYKILVARGKIIDIVAILKGAEEQALKTELISTLRAIEESYGKKLMRWSGDMSEMNLEPALKKFVMESYEPEEGIVISTFITLLSKLLYEGYTIIFDDAQWLEPYTMKILKLLIIRMSNENAGKIILSFNTDSDIPDDFYSFVYEYATDTLELHNMDFESCIEFVNFYCPDNVFSLNFYEKIYHCTKGNPLEMKNLLEHLKKENMIYEDGGFWHSREFRCPESRFVLPLLTSDDKEVLEPLSIIGFATLELMGEITALSKIKLIRILKKFENLGLIERRGDVYVFCHESMRNEIKKNVDEFMEREYKIAAAEYFESKGKYDYAAHILESVDPDKAFVLYLKLAKNALNMEDYRNAAGYYLRAAEVKSDESLYIKAAKLFEEIGDYRKVAYAYSYVKTPEGYAGHALAKAHLGETVSVNDELLMKKINAIVNYKRGDFKAALKYAIDVLNNENSWEFNILAGDCYLYLGDVESAEKHFNIAEKEESLSPLKKIMLKRKMLIAMLYGGNADTVLAEIDDVIEKAKKMGAWKETAALLNLKANALIAKKAREEGIRVYLEALRYSEMQDDVNLTSIILGNIGLEFMHSGEYEKALKYHHKVLRLFQRIKNSHGVAFTKLDIGQSYAGLGKWGLARKYLSEALSDLRNIGDISTALYTEFLLLVIEFIEKSNCEVLERLRRIYSEMKRIGDVYPQVEIGIFITLIESICGVDFTLMIELERMKSLMPMEYEVFKNMVFQGVNPFPENAMYESLCGMVRAKIK